MNKSLFENPQQELFAHINKTSLDITDERIEALKQLFPAIATDGKIDWNMLKAMLGESLEKESERYRFTWNGKNAAIMEAQTVSSKTLTPDIESSKNWDTTENLYIEGDNLEVLKLLQSSYNSKIKMIYIDPPYNTGNDFIYEDDFVLSQEEMETNEDIKDKKGTIRTLDRLQKNDKGSAKYHTNWLNMMYPRLSLARDLLTEDGVIFISIDDNEIYNLKKICDEIFGENNYIETLKWKKKKQPSFLAKHTAKVMEYIIIYAKKFDELEKLSIEGTTDSTKKVINISNAESTREFKAGVRIKIDGEGTLKAGRYKIKTMEVEYLNDIYYKDGRTLNNVNVKSKFSVSQEKINSYIDQNLLFITSQFGLRRDVSEEEMGKRKSITDLLLNEWGDNQESDNEFKILFDKKYFDYTKPSILIKNLIKSNHTENNIVLDFFSGSGTTAHAVMDLNVEDEGNRKFIMVQLPEELEEGSDAFKDGFRTICEIGRKRMELAGEKILSENPEASIDTGFKVFKVETSNIKEWDTEYPSVEASMNMALSGTLSMFKDGRSLLDIVYELILKERLPLTVTVNSEEINGSKLFNINEGMMYIYLGELNDTVVRRIVELKNESFDNNPKVILDESKLTTEMKSNAKKTFDSNGIKDVKTI